MLTMLTSTRLPVVFIRTFTLSLLYTLSTLTHAHSFAINNQTSLVKNNEAQSVPLFETFSAHIKGPKVSETDATNPFTDYLAIASITSPTGFTQNIRGFFVGDGQAQYSSADSGDLWQINYTPASKGHYKYTLSLYKGDKIALTTMPNIAKLRGQKALSQVFGEFTVKQNDKAAQHFAKNGFLSIKDGYFYFAHTQSYWLKSGANSPENLLGYWEIDGTYRASAQTRQGEAAADTNLHKYPTHIADYNTGDPLWGAQKNKGKGLIGAINYVAEIGMNAQYFLSMNIKGDGKDVFPYIDQETFDRFDISKLAQWEMVFSHMQNKGIMLHIVTQETENETLLDGGDVGKFRSLYYLELIARFGHHKALVWNLGEENGPASFSPIGQNDAQRLAMIAFFEANDPYEHPVLIHTHSTPPSKDKLLPALVDSSMDGVSFQIDTRTQVFDEIIKWREYSQKATSKNGKAGPWLISMDEIGMWYTGAKVDADDPSHDSLRQHVLWPTFLANGAGVEWYAGGRQPQNDLNLEDFRTRQSLWRISNIAKDFIQNNVPIWDMHPVRYPKDIEVLIAGYGDIEDKVRRASSVYAAKNQRHFLAYVIEKDSIEVDMPSGEYQKTLLDPISGEILTQQNININQASTTIKWSSMTSSIEASQNKDWVLHLESL